MVQNTPEQKLDQQTDAQLQLIGWKITFSLELFCVLDAYPFYVVSIFCVFSDIFVCALRASSTSPSSQSSKMNSMLYPKQFQSASAGMRIAQHFPGQFNPQVSHYRHQVSFWEILI